MQSGHLIHLLRTCNVLHPAAILDKPLPLISYVFVCFSPQSSSSKNIQDGNQSSRGMLFSYAKEYNTNNPVSVSAIWIDYNEKK